MTWAARARTCALIARRSSSRRSCQNPASMQPPTMAATSSVPMIQRGPNRTRQKWRSRSATDSSVLPSTSCTARMATDRGTALAPCTKRRGCSALYETADVGGERHQVMELPGRREQRRGGRGYGRKERHHREPLGSRWVGELGDACSHGIAADRHHP